MRVANALLAALVACGSAKTDALVVAPAFSGGVGKSQPLGSTEDGTYQRLLDVSELMEPDGTIILSGHDLQTALADMHLQKAISLPHPGVTHPADLLPPHLYTGESVDVTELVTASLPAVLAVHPTFAFMVEQVLGNDDFHASVYFGLERRDANSLSFADLCRRLVTSIYLFEVLLGVGRGGHRKLAQWYEALYTAGLDSDGEEGARAGDSSRSDGGSGNCDGSGGRPSSIRDALMGFFLTLKGESVLASINAFEQLRRLGQSACEEAVPLRPARTDVPTGRPPPAETRDSSDEAAAGSGAEAPGASSGTSVQAEVARLSTLLNAIMGLNIFEAVLSNLSFAFWPDNARAGMALLLTPLAPFRLGLTQDLDEEWFRLYLAWNANFIWPSHYCPDMMAFSMLCMPSIALGSPADFQYHRAHTLFWVVRSTQLTRRLSAEERVSRATAFGVAPAELRKPAQLQEVPCFHCRQLEPLGDRQPLTSRTAALTRASGEKLAARNGADVSSGSGVWRQLATQVLPQQLASLARIYRRMPKRSPTKLDLL